MLRLVAVLIAVGHILSFPRRFHRLSRRGIKSYSHNDPDEMKDESKKEVEYDSETLESLFLRVEEVGLDRIPDALRDSINKKIADNGPSDFEMKMNIMGITPFTVIGFAIGFVIIILNSTLGNGWATNLFFGDKVEDQVNTVSDNIHSQLPVSREVIDRIIKSHDEYLKEKVY